MMSDTSAAPNNLNFSDAQVGFLLTAEWRACTAASWTHIQRVSLVSLCQQVERVSCWPHARPFDVSCAWARCWSLTRQLDAFGVCAVCMSQKVGWVGKLFHNHFHGPQHEQDLSKHLSYLCRHSVVFKLILYVTPFSSQVFKCSFCFHHLLFSDNITLED